MCIWQAVKKQDTVDTFVDQKQVGVVVHGVLLFVADGCLFGVCCCGGLKHVHDGESWSLHATCRHDCCVRACPRHISIVSQSLPWISLRHQCWAVHIAWRSHYKGMARRADRVRMQSGIGNTMQSRALSTQSQKLLGIDNPCSLSWYLSRGLENPRPRSTQFVLLSSTE